MTLALTTRTAELDAASVRVPVPLVKITTYTDRVAGTVDATHYLSDRPVLYTYDGSERLFEPAVAREIEVAGVIPHLPDPDVSEDAPLGPDLALTLANVSLDSGTLFSTLNAETLRFARVEVSRVFVAPWEGESLTDLRGFGASQHDVVWRGEVAKVEDTVSGAMMRVLCQTEMPVLPWLYASNIETTDPKDLGKRLPLVYGSPNVVPGIGWQVGTTTTLAQPLEDATFTGIRELTDATGLPTVGAFTLRLGAGEQVTAARDSGGATGNEINITNRGVNNTPPTAHPTGAIVLEIVPEVKLTWGNASALRKLYLRNPVNGLLWPVEEGIYTVTEKDGSLISGASVLSVAITGPQLTTQLDKAHEAARVLVQPDFSSSPTVNTATAAHDNTLSATNGFALRSDISATRLTRNSASSLSRVVQLQWTSLAGTAILRARFYMRFRGVKNVSSSESLQIRMRLKDGNDTVRWDGGNTTIVASGLVTGTYSDILVYTPWNPVGFPITTLSSYNTFKLEYWLAGSGWQDTSYAELHGTFGLEYETEATADLSRTVDTEIIAASLGYGLEWFADVDGPTAPELFLGGFAPEASPSYSEAGVTHAKSGDDDLFTANEIVEDDCEATTGWGFSGTANPEDPALTSDATRGSNSIILVKTQSGRINSAKTFSSRDITGLLLAIDFKSEAALTLHSTDAVRLMFDNSAAQTNYREIAVGTSHGLELGVWKTIVVDPVNDTAVATAGTFDPATWTYLRVRMQQDAGQAGDTMKFDNIRWIPATMRAQLNGLTADPDMTAESDEYRVNAMVTQGSRLLTSTEVYFDNATGSGTTRPTNHVKVPMAADISAPTVIAGVDVGTPTVTAIDTFGVEMFPGTTPFAVNADPLPPAIKIVAVDPRATDAANPYTVSVGTVLEHPEDVWRHLLSELVSGSPLTLDETTLSALSTLLPSAKLAVDLRDLGRSFSRVAGRLAFETMTNLALRAGTLRFLAAESDFGFPAASVTLTGWKAFRVRGRDPGEVQTEFGALYDLDRTGDRDESGFLAGLRADKDTNDISGTLATSALTAGRAAFGVRPGPALGFLAVRDATAVEKALGYYASERLRDEDDLFEIQGADPAEAGALEEGDIFQATPPGESTPRKLRVVARAESLSGLPDLVAVEVT